MRDYKNVKVPRKYRTTTKNRTVVRQAGTGSGPGKSRGTAMGALETVLGVLLASALCYGGWTGYQWLSHAEMFQVAGVDVKGARAVGDNEIRELAALFTGQNVFRVDLGAAMRRALANPWVRDVRIERRLPNRISMIFTERVPRAVLQASNGQFLMDGDGVVMVPVPKDGKSAPPLPVIAVRNVRAVPRETVTAGAVPEALELVQELALRGGWSPAAVTVRADSAETITIVYADRDFRIGGGNYDEKLKRLGEIVADMQQRGLAFTYVELRPERQAAVMIAKNVKERRNDGKKGGRTGR